MCISIFWSHYIYITMHFYLASFIGNHIYIHFVALYRHAIIMHYLTFTSIRTVIINAAFGMTHSSALGVSCIQNLMHSHALYTWCIQNLQHSLLGQRVNATFHECFNNASEWRLQECRCIQAFMHYNTFCWAAFVVYSIYQNLVCLLVCLAFWWSDAFKRQSIF